MSLVAPPQNEGGIGKNYKIADHEIKRLVSHSLINADINTL